MHLEKFPLLTKNTYLNTAYVGPMSKALSEFRCQHEAAYLLKGGDYKVDAYAGLEDTHRVLANFFGASAANTFVVPNFSIGIRHALSLLPKNLNVLLLEEEYPSLRIAFEEGDFVIHKIPLKADVELQIEKRLAEGGIDILALSIVQYASGILIDIDFLNGLKNQYPDLILIGDGTQFLGAHVFHFDSSPFDLIAASGYKWLLAGFGNGVLMVSEFYLDRIQRKALTLFNRVFNGHFNILATASLRFAIEAFESQNFNLLMQSKAMLAQKAKQLLYEHGWISPWVMERKQHGSIFILEGEESLYKKLIDHKIQCVPRGKGVRVSFHYYNSEQDIHRLIEVLKK